MNGMKADGFNEQEHKDRNDLLVSLGELASTTFLRLFWLSALLLPLGRQRSEKRSGEAGQLRSHRREIDFVSAQRDGTETDQARSGDLRHARDLHYSYYCATR